MSENDKRGDGMDPEEYAEKFESSKECIVCGGEDIVRGYCLDCLLEQNDHLSTDVRDLEKEVKNLEREIEDLEEEADDPWQTGFCTDPEKYDGVKPLVEVFQEKDAQKMKERISKWMKEKKKDKAGKDRSVLRSIQWTQASGDRLYVGYLEDLEVKDARGSSGEEEDEEGEDQESDS